MYALGDHLGFSWWLRPIESEEATHVFPHSPKSFPMCVLHAGVCALRHQPFFTTLKIVGPPVTILVFPQFRLSF